jgi:hypothetical protein
VQPPAGVGAVSGQEAPAEPSADQEGQA